MVSLNSSCMHRCNLVDAAVHDSAIRLAVQRFSLNPGMSSSSIRCGTVCGPCRRQLSSDAVASEPIHCVVCSDVSQHCGHQCCDTSAGEKAHANHCAVTCPCGPFLGQPTANSCRALHVTFMHSVLAFPDSFVTDSLHAICKHNASPGLTPPTVIVQLIAVERYGQASLLQQGAAAPLS